MFVISNIFCYNHLKEGGFVQYLFLDIEGANCYNYVSKMCTFGYVITDNTFEIKTKIDVVMNPQSPFDKHIIKSKMNAYPLSKYNICPPFPYFYKSMKNILEAKDQLIFGWSIENDVKYIYDACNRYHLKQIQYEYFDIQKLIMKLENSQTVASLESIAEKYQIPKMTSHKSDDDAYLTMKIAKEVCKQQNISLSELYLLNKDCISSVSNYSTHTLSAKDIEEKLTRRRIANVIKNYTRKRIISNEKIHEGDVYAFMPHIILLKSKEIIDVIHYIVDCGASCTLNMSKCSKLVYIEKQENNKKDIDMITYDELLEAINNYQK